MTGDRSAFGGERALVRGSIDPAREPADHGQIPRRRAGKKVSSRIPTRNEWCVANR
mgnify:CR=1 FL=1